VLRRQLHVGGTAPDRNVTRVVAKQLEGYPQEADTNSLNEVCSKEMTPVQNMRRDGTYVIAVHEESESAKRSKVQSC
jgi:hypothetical protein